MTDEYADYLNSRKWRTKRRQCLAQSDHRCTVCGHKKQLQAHHLTYERIFNEDVSDLIALCKFHHEQIEVLIAAGRILRFGDVGGLRAQTIRLLGGEVRRRKKRANNQKRLRKLRPFRCSQPKIKWSNLSEPQRHEQAIERFEKEYA